MCLVASSSITRRSITHSVPLAPIRDSLLIPGMADSPLLDNRDARLARARLRVTKVLGSLIAWAWTIVAGGGGLGLLFRQGPWPPTNGWFALFSGVSACPMTAWLLKRYAGFMPPGYARLAFAVLFIVAGRTALAIEGHPFWPTF